MPKKFECMLFIDDDFMSNYYHKEIAEESEVAENLIFFTNPVEALDYLENEDAAGYQKPDIIFLDINMPQMSGWEFVEMYKHKVKSGYSDIIVISDSLDPLYPERAKNNQRIKDFQYKPLSLEYLSMLTNENHINKN